MKRKARTMNLMQVWLLCASEKITAAQVCGRPTSLVAEQQIINSKIV
jgi:hypothetical protein